MIVVMLLVQVCCSHRNRISCPSSARRYECRRERLSVCLPLSVCHCLCATVCVPLAVPVPQGIIAVSSFLKEYGQIRKAPPEPVTHQHRHCARHIGRRQPTCVRIPEVPFTSQITFAFWKGDCPRFKMAATIEDQGLFPLLDSSTLETPNQRDRNEIVRQRAHSWEGVPFAWTGFRGVLRAFERSAIGSQSFKSHSASGQQSKRRKLWHLFELRVWRKRCLN